MKKSKFTLVIVLGLVLCLLCGTVTTFSWFSRPRSKSGDTLKWSGSYPIANGEKMSYKTYESLDDGATFGTTEVKDLSGTVNAGERRYFCTEIRNAGTADQTVSLFLNNLKYTSTTTDGLYVGVNNPLKTYKKYAPITETADSKTVSTIKKKNVYVGFVYNKSYDPSQYGIWYWNSKGTSGSAGVTNKKLGEGTYTTTNASHNGYTEKYYVYASQIDYYADSMYLYYQNKDSKFDGGENTDIDNKNTVIWYEYGGSYHSSYVISGTAAGIEKFYSAATTTVGKTISLSATAQGTVSYTSSNPNVATVDSNGQVTAKSAGTTTITVTSTGAYGDTISANCTLTVGDKAGSNTEYVPIVTNLKVTKATLDGDMVSKVYWYLKNESSSPISYTVDNLYLSL